jgi:hypothetical protein
LHSATSGWQVGKPILRAGDLIQTVEQHFGTHPPDSTMRKVTLVKFVGLIPMSRQLVCARTTDVSNKFPDIKVILGKSVSQSIKQGWIRRRVTDPNVINGFNDPDSEEMGPNNICGVPRKIPVLF